MCCRAQSVGTTDRRTAQNIGGGRGAARGKSHPRRISGPLTGEPPLYLPETPLAGSPRADSLPVVEGVEYQPFSAQVRRVVEALDMLGQPLPDPVKRRIAQAERSTDHAEAVRAIQQALDEHCLIGITINPESRV